MFVSDKRIIGNRILMARKRLNLTQSQAAELAGLSDRAFADIERGQKNMTVSSICKICNALNVSPDHLLKDDYEEPELTETMLLAEFSKCSFPEKDGAMKILSAYMESLKVINLQKV